MENFLVELEATFPELDEIPTFHDNITFLRRANPKLIVEYFMYFILVGCQGFTREREGMDQSTDARIHPDCRTGEDMGPV